MGSKEKSIRVPQQARSQETRTKLLEAGSALFARKGYHGTNSKEIAREAGVAVGSFYAYFKDKRSLLLELLEDFKEHMFSHADLDAEMIQGLREKPKHFFVHLLQALVSSHETHRELHNQLIVMSVNDPEVGEMFAEWKRLVQTHTREMLSYARDLMRVSDFDAAVCVVSITIIENVHFINSKPEGVEQESFIQEVADLISRYLFVTPD